MDLFLKYKRVILRSLGIVMLVVGSIVYFWVMPQKGVSENNDKAAARVARMEAKVKGVSTQVNQSSKKDNSKFLEKLKAAQEKQKGYMIILVILLGSGFLVYSFIPKKD